MKKVISGALAAAIITSNLPLRVLAEEINIPDANQNDQSINQEKTRTGYIEVEIKLDMPIMYSADAKIKVDLSESGEKTLLSAKLGKSGNFEDSNGHSYSVEALGYKGVEEVKDGGKVYVYKVRFNNLTAAKGKNYNININGNGFRAVSYTHLTLPTNSRV